MQTFQRELGNPLGDCHFPVECTKNFITNSDFTWAMIVVLDGKVNFLQTSSFSHKIPTENKNSLWGFRNPVGNDKPTWDSVIVNPE